MAHPKHKISKTRDKRRTQYKAVAPTVAVCSNQDHLFFTTECANAVITKVNSPPKRKPA